MPSTATRKTKPKPKVGKGARKGSSTVRRVVATGVNKNGEIYQTHRVMKDPHLEAWDRLAASAEVDEEPEEPFVDVDQPPSDPVFVLRTRNVDMASPLVELGPLYDEDDVEEAILELLTEHPFEPAKFAYSLLTLGVNGDPDIEPVGIDYLASLMVEAWWEDVDEEDDDEF